MRILKCGTGDFLNTRIQQNNCSFTSVSQISMEICKRLKARYCLLLLQDIHASSGTNPIILHVHVQCTCTCTVYMYMYIVNLHVRVHATKS